MHPDQQPQINYNMWGDYLSAMYKSYQQSQINYNSISISLSHKSTTTCGVIIYQLCISHINTQINYNMWANYLSAMYKSYQQLQHVG